MRQRRGKSSYSVGYCKPPDKAKWAPGQSGNPSGRPKVPPLLEDLFLKEAMKSIAIKSGDRVTHVSKIEAVLMATLNKAVAGNPQSTKRAIDEYRRAQALAARRDDTPPERHFDWSEEQAELMREIERIGREVNVDDPSDRESE